MYIYNERTKQKVAKDRSYIRGIVNIYKTEDGLCLEQGFFKPDSKTVMFFNKYNGCKIPCISGNLSEDMIFSKKMGYYMIKPDSRSKLIEHKYIKGHGDFPYDIPREYEAIKNLNKFQGVEYIVDNKVYELSKYLKYTFGLEFETSAGFVPQDLCYRDGLIPLRDGSISGVEYSSIVLSGNDGLNILRQECETLNEYTEFNKNCALHIHFGGYPINPVQIFALYKILYSLQPDIECLIPEYSFHTGMYKDNGKEYCAELPYFKTFNEFYSYMSCNQLRFLGDLYQAHPCDIERERKWNIQTRYHNFNFINMLFYDCAKTLELRFLRPTFNFEKIKLWIAIFNAILSFAQSDSAGLDLKTLEKEERRYSSITLMDIFYSVYPDNITDELIDGVLKLKCAKNNQAESGDPIGARVDIEDKIF